MKGYKAFNHNWICRNDFQYEIGKIYQMDENHIELCEKGFHFCQLPIDIFKYYKNNNCKYAEIFASGKILEDNDKCVCSQIEIIKELSKEQIYELSTGLFLQKDGIERYYQNGKLSRLDGPAVEHSNGRKEWWINGIRHRLDGPAVEWADGTKYWYLNGKLHREDGPAFESSQGMKQWWLNGFRHRSDGPAIECADGTNRWYVNGLRHRENGPAISMADGMLMV
jgi:hypothetical protein